MRSKARCAGCAPITSICITRTRTITSVEQSEYVAAFDRLIREGKVHAVGASNFTPERLHSALELARSHGLRGFEVSQDHWNLVERKLERTLVPVIDREGLKELPYFSLASGFLTGKYRPGRSAASARATRASEVPRRSAQREAARPRSTSSPAHHVASVAAIALAWLKAHAVVGAPIASARTVDQLDSLFEAGHDQARARRGREAVGDHCSACMNRGPGASRDGVPDSSFSRIYFGKIGMRRR